MLFLLIQVGNERYAFDARLVLKILPFPGLQHLPGAPRGVAGMFTYGGEPVLAVDLCEVKLGRPASRDANTRVVLTEYLGQRERRLLGLLAESPLELLPIEPVQAGRSGLPPSQPAGAGRFLLSPDGPVQRLRQEELVSEGTLQGLLGPGENRSGIAAASARSAGPLTGARLSALVFRVGGEWFALPTSLLDQVAPMRPIHSLPHHQKGVLLGLANIRGELVTCISLERLLGLQGGSPPQGRSASQKRLVVVNWEGARLAFPVGEAHGPCQFQNEQVRLPPTTLPSSGLSYTRNLLPWKEQAAGLLDPELLFPTVKERLK